MNGYLKDMGHFFLHTTVLAKNNFIDSQNKLLTKYELDYCKYWKEYCNQK